MNVRECYEIMNGDYEDVKRRFLSDTRIRKFALLFLGDNSMEELREAMGLRNRERGFQAAHTLKGICLNLGFAGLFVPVNRITEMQFDISCYETELNVLEEFHLKYLEAQNNGT